MNTTKLAAIVSASVILPGNIVQAQDTTRHNVHDLVVNCNTVEIWEQSSPIYIPIKTNERLKEYVRAKEPEDIDELIQFALNEYLCWFWEVWAETRLIYDELKTRLIHLIKKVEEYGIYENDEKSELNNIWYNIRNAVREHRKIR